MRCVVDKDISYKFCMMKRGKFLFSKTEVNGGIRLMGLLNVYYQMWDTQKHQVEILKDEEAYSVEQDPGEWYDQIVVIVE